MKISALRLKISYNRHNVYFEFKIVHWFLFCNDSHPTSIPDSRRIFCLSFSTLRKWFLLHSSFNPHGRSFQPQDMIIELFLWRVNQRSRCCRSARLIFPLVKVKATVAKIIRLSLAAQKLLCIFKQSVAIQRREIHLHCFLEHKESTVWAGKGQGVRRLTLLFPFLSKL